MHDLFPSPWLVNTLFDEGYIAQKREELGKAPLPYGWSPGSISTSMLKCSPGAANPS